jgi:lycopene cyclase domain-containing protein
MTYFGFLALFVGIPIAALLVIAIRDHRQGRVNPPAFGNFPGWLPILITVIIAVAWTTPWDNYLVATRVWWYDPALVTGITLGYVPIEEYTFFVVQPIMTGLWLLFLMRRLRLPADAGTALDGRRTRRLALAAAGIVWVAGGAVLFSGWEPGRYLGLELIWALPPLMLQLAFGSDILRRHWRLVLLGIVPTTAYLSFADALAIGSGTWTINPALSLGVYLGGVLPLEEMLFFLLTNTLVVFSVTLALAQESKARVSFLVRRR